MKNLNLIRCPNYIDINFFRFERDLDIKKSAIFIPLKIWIKIQFISLIIIVHLIENMFKQSQE